jgi:hypothetical protein
MADENNQNQTQQTQQTNQTTQTTEETLSITKTELENRLNGKFGEGAKKAAKDLLAELGVKTKEEAIARLAELKEAQDARSKAEVELSSLKAERAALKYGADEADVADVVAMLKGKGQELTEENIKAVVEKYFKKQQGSTPSGVKPNQNKGTGGAREPKRVW